MNTSNDLIFRPNLRDLRCYGSTTHSIVMKSQPIGRSNTYKFTRSMIHTPNKQYMVNPMNKAHKFNRRTLRESRIHHVMHISRVYHQDTIHILHIMVLSPHLNRTYTHTYHNYTSRARTHINVERRPCRAKKWQPGALSSQPKDSSAGIVSPSTTHSTHITLHTEHTN